MDLRRSNRLSPIFATALLGILIVSLAALATTPAAAQSYLDYLTIQPVTDANPLTNDDGRANTNINNVPFKHGTVTTVGGFQFTSYYRTDGRLLVGRRPTGGSTWDLTTTEFTSANINDSHNTSSIAIDGNGLLHMAWGLHGDSLFYTTSTASVLNNNSPMQFIGGNVGNSAALNSMTGLYNGGVTYPEFYNLPDGDLLYTWRNGSSGSGDYRIRRYDAASSQWEDLGYGASDIWIGCRAPGSTLPDVNAYPNELAFDSAGNIHATWTWRTGADTTMGQAGFQTNHNINYARSSDGGATWTNMQGVPYTTPIYETNAQVAIPLPEGSSLINTTGMTVDKLDQPVLATWWAPNAALGDHRRQYMLAWYDNAQDAWQTSQISSRTIDGPAKTSEAVVRDLGRPIVVVDDDNRVIVAYRDNQGANGLTIAYSESPNRDDWQTFDLTTEDLGDFEPNYDVNRWRQDGVLSMLYQGTNLGQTGSPVSVLEWDARSYFAALDAPKLRLIVNSDTGAVSIRNTIGEAVVIDGYSIRSASGALDPGSWASLQDQGIAGWQQSNVGPTQLNELNQIGSLALNAGDAQNLGTPFQAAAVPFGQTPPNGDLVFQYTSPGGAPVNGFVKYEGYNNFVLFVDPLSGEAILKNSSSTDVAIDGYTITSPSGSLEPSSGSWNSLDDQNISDGQWHEANASVQRLSELRFNGSTMVEGSDALSLGALFDPSGSHDLSLQVLLAGNVAALNGVVVYRIPGDFDGSGSVDSQDLTAWKASLGASADADADLDGDSDGHDFLLWQRHLGTTVSAIAVQAAVPEPRAWLLAYILLSAVFLRHRDSACRCHEFHL